MFKKAKEEGKTLKKSQTQVLSLKKSNSNSPKNIIIRELQE